MRPDRSDARVATRPTLSIVCPSYQEEEVLPRFHAALAAVLDGLSDEFTVEILYVDDGSTDATLAVLRRLAALDRRVRYVSLSRNFGHQAALSAGLEHARGDVVVSLDSDLQHPPEVILELLDRWQNGYDVVLTEREDAVGTGWFKQLTSASFYWLMRRVSDIPVTPAASDFRLLTRPALDALVGMREMHRFLRGMVNWLGFRSTSVRFRAAPRAAGRSRYTLGRMMRLASDGLLSFSSLPLRLPLYIGAAVTLTGLFLAAAAAVRTILGAGPGTWLIEGQTVLTVTLDGFVLFSVGLLGEYLGRVHDEVKGRPLYVVKEASPATALRLHVAETSRSAV